jgi:hypothetical protein
MIQITNEGETFKITQKDRAPSVYLDHWALRNLSADSDLTRQFVSALKSSGGTLYLSGVGVAEFSRMSDPGSVAKAEELVQECVPSLFFLESNPWTVMANEGSLLAGGKPSPPHADFAMASLIPSLGARGLELWGVRGLFEAVAGSESLRGGFDSLGDAVAARLTESRSIAPERFQPVPGPGLQRATRSLATELLRLCVSNTSMRLGGNDGIDLFHAVVPASYGNIVLLDRRWGSLTLQAISRLRRTGHGAEMATVLSGKGAINKMIEILECHVPRN